MTNLITLKTKQNTFRLITLLPLLLILQACGHMANKHYRSSVVDYLYPGQVKPVSHGTSELALPLNLGIAFVPGSSSISEVKKLAVMRKVRKHFEGYGFIRNIEIIPSAYLKHGGSFENLDQIKLMHSIDVIALISYDQKQFTDEGFASISYLTLVGAYIFQGEKNDTQTMVDTTVYHIDSRQLLFRAPGVNHIKSSATPINLSEQLRLDRNRGIDKASQDMIDSLDKELQNFRALAKNSKAKVKLRFSQDYPSPY